MRTRTMLVLQMLLQLLLRTSVSLSAAAVMGPQGRVNFLFQTENWLRIFQTVPPMAPNEALFLTSQPEVG